MRPKGPIKKRMVISVAPELLHEFRIMMARRGLQPGEATEEAVREWLEKNEKVFAKSANRK